MSRRSPTPLKAAIGITLANSLLDWTRGGDQGAAVSYRIPAVGCHVITVVKADSGIVLNFQVSQPAGLRH